MPPTTGSLTGAPGGGEPDPGPGARVVETHSAVLFFVGDRVYKVKKAVDLGFLDHRDREARLATCRQEVALNRRLAPDAYLGVWDLVGPDGEPCDHLVVMRRMPEDRSLRRVVTAGTEDVDDALRLVARALAALHAGAPVTGPALEHAALASVRRNWTDAFAQLRTLEEPAGLDPTTGSAIEQLVERYLAGRAPLFAQRIADGQVRDGHGDLMADDIYLLPEGPQVLDCLEFDERYRIADVLADVAFLAMDLERLGRPDLARRFLALYREMSAATWPPSLEHHWIAYRAHLRAKVGAVRQVQEGRATDPAVTALLGLALDHLERGQVRLVVVGGLPGTGTSTVAAGLADALDATLLRTDEVRQRTGPTDPAERYSPEAVRAVYLQMLDEACHLLALGHHVVLDGNWPDAGLRARARAVAADTASTLTELVCTAPAEVAAGRIERRRARGDDPSEATPAVAATLAERFTPWPEATALDTTTPVADTLDRALRAVREQPPPTPAP